MKTTSLLFKAFLFTFLTLLLLAISFLLLAKKSDIISNIFSIFFVAFFLSAFFWSLLFGCPISYDFLSSSNHCSPWQNSLIFFLTIITILLPIFLFWLLSFFIFSKFRRQKKPGQPIRILITRVFHSLLFLASGLFLGVLIIAALGFVFWPFFQMAKHGYGPLLGLSGQYFFVLAKLTWPLILLISAVGGGFWAYRFRHQSLETILTTLLNKIRPSWQKFIITIIILISLLVSIRVYLQRKTLSIIREAEKQYQKQLQ